MCWCIPTKINKLKSEKVVTVRGKMMNHRNRNRVIEGMVSDGETGRVPHHNLTRLISFLTNFGEIHRHVQAKELKLQPRKHILAVPATDIPHKAPLV